MSERNEAVEWWVKNPRIDREFGSVIGKARFKYGSAETSGLSTLRLKRNCLNGPWSRAVQTLWPCNMFRQPKGETKQQQKLRTKKLDHKNQSYWFQISSTFSYFQFPCHTKSNVKYHPWHPFWCPGSTGYCLWFQAIESQYLENSQEFIECFEFNPKIFTFRTFSVWGHWWSVQKVAKSDLIKEVFENCNLFNINMSTVSQKYI